MSGIFKASNGNLTSICNVEVGWLQDACKRHVIFLWEDTLSQVILTKHLMIITQVIYCESQQDIHKNKGCTSLCFFDDE
jgi:hypothetical protein